MTGSFLADYRRRRRTRRLMVAGALLILALAGAWLGIQRLMRPVVPHLASDAEHFKYGSIGNDAGSGIPLPIWAVLPRVFPEYLPGPGGYASLGFRWEAGRDRRNPPAGFSKARVGVDRVSINCATCHITTYRLRPEAPLQFALAGTSNAVDILGYQRFLTASARDSRFSADILLPAMAEAGIRLGWAERQLYRHVLIPATRKALREQGARFAWTSDRPSWGPGRIDPFNPVKFGILGLPVDRTIGNSDMQPVWGLDLREAIRKDGAFHWDGLNDSVREVVLSSALGDGSDPGAFEAWRPSINRIERFLRSVRPPPSPHRAEAAAAARGQRIFEAGCSSCHGERGHRTLTVVSAAEVGTDPERVRMWTARAAATYNGYARSHGFDFRRFRNIEGYLSPTLEGLWLRAPYLHNGSVPTLADLLEPPERRPTAFIRGGETLDPVRGGFIAPPCDPSAPRRGRYCHDTSLPGNGNGGHLYGTRLPPSQKADLLAFLLTR